VLTAFNNHFFESAVSLCCLAKTSVTLQWYQNIKCQSAFYLRYEQVVSVWNFTLAFQAVVQKMAFAFQRYFFCPVFIPVFIDCESLSQKKVTRLILYLVKKLATIYMLFWPMRHHTLLLMTCCQSWSKYWIIKSGASCMNISTAHLYLVLLICRAHSFPQVTEFRAKLQNLPFSAEFWFFRRISFNFAEIEKWPMISMIVGFTT